MVNIDRIIKETINKACDNIICESQGLSSMKIYNAIKQHGGISKHDISHNTVDLHNLTDDEFIGIIPSFKELKSIQDGHTVDHWRWADNYGLDKWAKDNGIDLDRGDRVEAIGLNDGSYMAVIVRNEGLVNGRDDGWKKYYDKRTQREKNQRGDGSKTYIWKNKEARDILTNPYFKKWPKEHQDDAMNKAREFKKRKNPQV
jgi:hypothetical protein